MAPLGGLVAASAIEEHAWALVTQVELELVDVHLVLLALVHALVRSVTVALVFHVLDVLLVPEDLGSHFIYLPPKLIFNHIDLELTQIVTSLVQLLFVRHFHLPLPLPSLLFSKCNQLATILLPLASIRFLRQLLPLLPLRCLGPLTGSSPRRVLSLSLLPLAANLNRCRLLLENIVELPAWHPEVSLDHILQVHLLEGLQAFGLRFEIHPLL